MSHNSVAMCYFGIMPCIKTPYPLSNVPRDFGLKVRKARLERHWSQAVLAKRVGVSRKTIVRLERGLRPPSFKLATALLRQEVLGQTLPTIPGWEIDDPDAWPRGLRARAARHASGQKLREIVAEAGGSVASLSSFERCLLAPEAYGGDPEVDDANSATDAYAQALGFTDAVEMECYLKADDPLPFLTEIARRHGRKLPPAALLPTRRLRLFDDPTEVTALRLD